MLVKAKERMVLGNRYDYYMNDKIVGSIWVEKQDKALLYVWDINIKDGYKNQGYEERIIYELIKLFPDKKIFSKIRIENSSIVKAYIKLGFKKIDSKYNYITVEREGDK